MITINKAQLADLPRLLEIQKQAYQSEADLYGDASIPPLTETLEEAERAWQSCVILKAGIAGEIVGSVRAHLNGTTCEIGRLSVSPEHQKRGIGTALLRACETAFPEAAACELFTGSQSTDNLRLYEKLGYRRHKTQELSPRVTLVFLQKPISPTTAAAASLAAQLADDQAVAQAVQSEIEQSKHVSQLIALRVQAGLSQAELAQRMGCSPSKIVRIESGKDSELSKADADSYLAALNPHARAQADSEKGTF